jgi:demethylspheroidene O-methyltransferase
MSDISLPTGASSRKLTVSGRINRLIATPKFQAWAARFPLTRRMVRRDGEALFDLVAGFCHSQVLMALVDLRVPDMLMDGPMGATALGHRCRIPADRMAVLLRAAVSMDLLKITRGGEFKLSRKGAALVGVPGLREMILHHSVLYADLADPVAFFRGEVETQLAGFWPYVFGADGQGDPQVAATYSDLMAQSQLMVAQDTLSVVSFKGTKTLMDIGGGTGAFLRAALLPTPDLRGTLFDLPEVVAKAPQGGLSDRINVAGGSFRHDPLPKGADAISLIRVLYDHADETVAALLSKIYDVLPAGGKLIISEPMTGGDTPHRAGDAYFSLYTMAMRTGKARSADQIMKACQAAGFTTVSALKSQRPFITSVVVAEKKHDNL